MSSPTPAERPNDAQINAAVDAVSRAVYDLTTEHISPMGVSVGTSVNGVIRLTLRETVEMALNAAARAGVSLPPTEPSLDEILDDLVAAHASMLADAEKAESKSRAHNLRTKAAGVGLAIGVLRENGAAAGVSLGPPTAERNEAAERIQKFLDAAGTLVEGDVLFGVPGSGVTLLLSDMRILARAGVSLPPTDAALLVASLRETSEALHLMSGHDKTFKEWATCQQRDCVNVRAMLERAAAGVSLPPTADAITTILASVMVDPTACSCGGTGWTFNDKSYDGYEHGAPYREPTRDNGGYSPCGFCNLGGWDHDPDENGDLMPAERRWDDDEIAEIATALAAGVSLGPSADRAAYLTGVVRHLSDDNESLVAVFEAAERVVEAEPDVWRASDLARAVAAYEKRAALGDTPEPRASTEPKRARNGETDPHW